MSGHTPSELVQRLRENADMMRDGHQRNLTELCHSEVVTNAAKDAVDAAGVIAANEAKIEALTAALEGRKAAILAERDLHRWTNEDSAWHRAFGELSGLNYALEEMRVAALTSAGEK